MQCGVIVRRGLMLVAFVGNLGHEFTLAQTYIHKHLLNIYENYHELATNKITPIQTNQEHFGYPQSLTPRNKIDSTAYEIVQFQLLVYHCILQLKYIKNWPFSLHNVRIY